MTPFRASRDPKPRVVEEVPVEGVPALTHPEWRRAFPWLAQGTTCGRTEAEPFDLGLFADASPPSDVWVRWDRLREATGLPEVVHARQVHSAMVRFHGSGAPGLRLAEPCDGHATHDPGVLLAVTTADCVPVFVVDPARRAIALLHAGWRGTAAGVLEAGVALLQERAASRPADLHVHLGPAICGTCYEVGPEVFAALGLPRPRGASRLDLRADLARRALSLGVSRERLSASAHCTRCGNAGLFSHRGGDRARQAGFLGVRP